MPQYSEDFKRRWDEAHPDNKPKVISKKPMRIHWLFNELRNELIAHQARTSEPGYQRVIDDVDGSHHDFQNLEENRTYEEYEDGNNAA